VEVERLHDLAYELGTKTT